MTRKLFEKLLKRSTRPLSPFSAVLDELPEQENASLAAVVLHSGRELSTELKLPPERVSTDLAGLPEMQVTREMVERILRPISVEIRQWMTCGRYESLGSDSFASVRVSLLTAPVFGHPLWQQQKNQVMKWPKQCDNLSAESNFLNQCIDVIPHENFVSFCAYRASSAEFAKNPRSGCSTLLGYVHCEPKTQGNKTPEVISVIEIMKDYLANQATEYLQLEPRTFFLDFDREYQQITLNVNDWDVSYLKNEMVSNLVWKTIWNRISALHQECRSKNLPLQISMPAPSRNSDFLIKMGEQAVKFGIFVEFVGTASSHVDKFNSPIQDSLFSKGLPWKDVGHANEQLEYLDGNNLLGQAT